MDDKDVSGNGQHVIAFSWLEIDTFRKFISLVFIKSIVPRRFFLSRCKIVIVVRL